jgi:hypothetical protein
VQNLVSAKVVFLLPTAGQTTLPASFILLSKEKLLTQFPYALAANLIQMSS